MKTTLSFFIVIYSLFTQLVVSQIAIGSIQIKKDYKTVDVIQMKTVKPIHTESKK